MMNYDIPLQESQVGKNDEQTYNNKDENVLLTVLHRKCFIAFQ